MANRSAAALLTRAATRDSERRNAQHFFRVSPRVPPSSDTSRVSGEKKRGAPHAGAAASHSFERHVFVRVRTSRRSSGAAVMIVLTQTSAIRR